MNRISRFLPAFVSVVAIVASVATQISPDDATSNLAAWVRWLGIDCVPAWLERSGADNWGLSIAIIVLLVMMIYKIHGRYLDRKGRKISMKDAERQAYEEFCHTEIVKTQNRLGIESDSILGIMANLIVLDASVEVFGEFPPSKNMERIPDVGVDQFMFSGDATALFDQFHPERRYVNINIAHRDFERRLRELKSRHRVE